MIVGVSACLLGISCRYDGENSINYGLIEKLRGFSIIPFCPEELGGLPTPRPPANLIGGDGRAVLNGYARVMDINGKDVTKEFIIGAEKALRLLQRMGIKSVYLKARSPSCGADAKVMEKGQIVRRAQGVAYALFYANGIKIFNV